MKRDLATSRIKDVLEATQGDSWLVPSIKEIWVFGSYAKGSLEPNDIDLEVVIDPDDAYASQRDASFGNRDVRNPKGELWRLLFGRRRCFHAHIEEQRWYADVGHRLIFERGDDLETALRRLETIEPDPEYVRAERTLPQLRTLEGRISTGELTEVTALVEAKWISAEPLTLDLPEEDDWIPDMLSRFYKPGSPLLRAASAGVLEFDDRGVSSQAIGVMDHYAFSPAAGSTRRRPSPTHEVGWSASLLESGLTFLTTEDACQYLFLVKTKGASDEIPAILFTVDPQKRDSLRRFLELRGLIEEKEKMLPNLTKWLGALPNTRFTSDDSPPDDQNSVFDEVFGRRSAQNQD